jgi:hypothetical protein
LLEQAKPRVVVKVLRRHGVPLERIAQVGAAQEGPLVVFMEVLLGAREQHVHDVGERRVRDVVQQAGDLLDAGRGHRPQQQIDADAVVEAGGDTAWKHERRGPGLMDSTQALKRGRSDDVQRCRIRDRHRSEHWVLKVHCSHPVLESDRLVEGQHRGLEGAHLSCDSLLLPLSSCRRSSKRWIPCAVATSGSSSS